MVVAGNETTTKLLSNAVYWAWRNPAQLAKPMTDPARITDWVEETLRYDASSQIIARTVAEGFRLHGQTVPAGGRLLLLIGSANRDPAAFPAPDDFDLDRDTSALISFGAGRHYCLGANLARLEAQIALTEFTRLVAGVRDRRRPRAAGSLGERARLRHPAHPRGGARRARRSPWRHVMTLLEPRLVSGGAAGGHLEELRRDPIALMRRVRDECGDVGRFDLAGRPVILLSGAAGQRVLLPRAR